MDLNEIRTEIDNIDEQLLRLFCKRMDLVKDVAEYKMKNNIDVFRPERENEILNKISEKAKDEYGVYAKDLFENLMRISRQMQTDIIKK